MKIFFLGSIPDKPIKKRGEIVTEAANIVNACRQIGYSAAKHGHTVLLGSENINTIDLYIAEGVKRYCEEEGSHSAIIEVHRREGTIPIFADYPRNLRIDRIYYHGNQQNKWTVAHVRVLESCDVMITLGGEKNTRAIGNLAADKEIPVIAIGSFGGSSNELYEGLKYIYKNKYNISANLHYLISEWKNDYSEEIISLAETINQINTRKQPHTYFISYSRLDCTIADHVELLLRRNNRIVFRDESDIEAGTRLSSAVTKLIENSDTFISIWSKNYTGSQWCLDELEFARNKKNIGERVQRIILVNTDNQELPIHFSDFLSVNGLERDKRELGMRKILDYEKK